MRAKILFLVCAAYFLSGWQVYHTHIAPAVYKQLDPSVTAHLRLFTLHQIGLMFMLVSAISAGVMLFEELRPRARMAVKLRELGLGYALMTFVLMFWTLLYILSWIQTGYWQSVYGVANYGLTVGILMLCSRIVEPIPGARESFNTPLPLEELTANLKKINEIEGGKS